MAAEFPRELPAPTPAQKLILLALWLLKHISRVRYLPSRELVHNTKPREHGVEEDNHGVRAQLTSSMEAVIEEIKDSVGSEYKRKYVS